MFCYLCYVSSVHYSLLQPLASPGGPAWEEIVEVEMAKYVLTLPEFIFISFPLLPFESNMILFFGACKDILALPGLKMNWKLEVSLLSRRVKACLNVVGIWKQDKTTVAFRS